MATQAPNTTTTTTITTTTEAGVCTCNTASAHDAAPNHGGTTNDAAGAAVDAADARTCPVHPAHDSRQSDAGHPRRECSFLPPPPPCHETHTTATTTSTGLPKRPFPPKYPVDLFNHGVGGVEVETPRATSDSPSP
jgi:hypothetical protein